jgi:hypothetical protein
LEQDAQSKQHTYDNTAGRRRHVKDKEIGDRFEKLTSEFFLSFVLSFRMVSSGKKKSS